MANEKNRRPDQGSEGEEFRELEGVLRKLADTGALDECPEEMPLLPASVSERLLRNVQAQDELRVRLRAAHAKTNRATCSFEGLIRSLREHAGVSVEDAAQAVRMERSELLAIEDGTVDVLQLAPEALVKLMEVFSIKLPLFESSVKRSIGARQARARLTTPMARTTNAEARDVERAVQDMAEFFAEESGVSAVTLPPGYIERIRTTLDRWGRTDLL